MSSHKWFIALVLGLAVSVPSYGQLPDNVLRRTVLISVPGSGMGTAFSIDVGGRQYLITAKHVVAGIDSALRAQIEIRRGARWLPLQVIVYKCDDPVDIAVLIPPVQLTVDLPLEPDSSGLTAGQDAYFIGFPYGLRFAPSGLVRKAVVAQLERTGEKKTGRILLDTRTDPGLSGSPLTYRAMTRTGPVFEVGGVIVAFEADQVPVLRKREVHIEEITADDRARNRLTFSNGKWYRLEDTGDRVQLNTGIAVAWDIQPALDLIRRYPFGPKVSGAFRDD